MLRPPTSTATGCGVPPPHHGGIGDSAHERAPFNSQTSGQSRDLRQAARAPAWSAEGITKSFDHDNVCYTFTVHEYQPPVAYGQPVHRAFSSTRAYWWCRLSLQFCLPRLHGLGGGKLILHYISSEKVRRVRANLNVEW